MPFIEIDGSPLHYQDRGTGFPVLLGHSYLWDAAMWTPQVEALSRSFRVLVPDLWGHGLSGDMPAGTRSLGDLAGQMGRFLDALGIDVCAVAGLSVGGMWAAELALCEPARVRALILMDTDFGEEPEASRTRYLQMLDATETLGLLPPAVLDAVVPMFFRKEADLAGALPAAFRQALEALPAERLRASIVPLGRLIFGRPDGLSRLGALDADRTLLMCGAEDIPRPPSETLRMAGLIGCEHLILPDAGHIANLENASFVTEAMADWFHRRLDIPPSR